MDINQQLMYTEPEAFDQLILYNLLRDSEKKAFINGFKASHGVEIVEHAEANERYSEQYRKQYSEQYSNGFLYGLGIKNDEKYQQELNMLMKNSNSLKNIAESMFKSLELGDIFKIEGEENGE